MVNTRRTALVPDDETSNTAAGPSDMTRGTSRTKRHTNQNPTRHIVPTKDTRKRENARPAKRAEARGPTASRPPNTLVTDEHENDIPDDALLKDINEKAAHKPRAKRAPRDGQDVDMAAEDQLLRESQWREEIVAAQDREEGPGPQQEEGADGHESDEDGTADGQESAMFVEQDDEDELEELQQESVLDDGNSNDNEPVVASSAAPQAQALQIEMEERSRRAKQAREEREREIREQQHKQMMLFVASTQRAPVRVPQNRDEYFDKHGWRLWEDEILVGAIRKAKSPNLSVLAEQIPRRTTREVTDRVGQLREWMRTGYESAGIEPPKWCYY